MKVHVTSNDELCSRNLQNFESPHTAMAADANSVNATSALAALAIEGGGFIC